MNDNGVWQTIFMVCGENINLESFGAETKLPRVVFVESGEIDIPSIEDGARRLFDNRTKLNCLKASLSSKQSQAPLISQLNYWYDILKPMSELLNKLHNDNSWIVIDCHAYKDSDSFVPSLQFRITDELIFKFGSLRIDLDFTIDP